MPETEIKLCEIVGPKLVDDGLYLVGIDLMGGKLIEVNVCSPGGFVEINETKSTDDKIQKNVLNFVEQVIEKRTLNK